MKDHNHTATSHDVGSSGRSNRGYTLDSLVSVTDDARVPFSRMLILMFYGIALTVQHDRFVDFLSYNRKHADTATVGINPLRRFLPFDAAERRSDFGDLY